MAKCAQQLTSDATAECPQVRVAGSKEVKELDSSLGKVMQEAGFGLSTTILITSDN